MINLKLRLEKLCDKRSWARLHFADGTSLTGRVLRVGHDYIEIESYGETDSPGRRDYSKHLVPLSLIKYITVESTVFSEAERNRLTFLSDMDSTQESLPELEK